MIWMYIPSYIHRMSPTVMGRSCAIYHVLTMAPFKNGWTSIQKKQLNFCLNIQNSRGFHWPTAMCEWWSNMGIIINQWGVINILSWWFPIDWWLMMGMGRCCTWSEFWLLHFNIQLQVSIWVHPYIGNQLATWEWCLQLSFCLVFVALFWGPAWNNELWQTCLVPILLLCSRLSHYSCWHTPSKIDVKNRMKPYFWWINAMDPYGSTGSIVDLKSSLR